MITLPTSASVERALKSTTLSASLHAFLSRRLDLTRAAGIADMTLYLCIEPDDTEDATTKELGWSPLVNPIDGSRYGTKGFCPFWDWLAHDDGLYEMIVTVGNAGYAVVLAIEDRQGVIPQLLSLCRAYAR